MAGTLIDPTSVEIRLLDHAADFDVLDTIFPHRRPQTLYWHIDGRVDAEVRVEISYFTSGLTWEADYVVVADEDDALASVEGFVRVHNRSGEDYANASIRVVVGSINLVERIAELARVPMHEVVRLADAYRDELRLRAAKSLMSADLAHEAAAAPPAGIIKEGLSEYFIYTLPAHQTVPDGWSKRIRSFFGTGVPFETRYRYRPREYGDALVRMLLLTNDAASGLGETPLPDGTVRVFRAVRFDDPPGLGFVAALPVRYVAIGDRIELNLGPDPAVGFDLRALAVRRDEIWLRLGGGDLYRRVDDGDVRLALEGRVAGWTEHTIYRQRVRNHHPAPVEIEIRHEFGGDVEFVSALDARNHDYRTVQYTVRLAPHASADLLYEVLSRHGRSKRQERVRVRRGTVDAPFASAVAGRDPVSRYPVP